jgi:hypothetical protein
LPNCLQRVLQELYDKCWYWLELLWQITILSVIRRMCDKSSSKYQHLSYSFCRTLHRDGCQTDGYLHFLEIIELYEFFGPRTCMKLTERDAWLENPGAQRGPPFLRKECNLHVWIKFYKLKEGIWNLKVQNFQHCRLEIQWAGFFGASRLEIQWAGFFKKPAKWQKAATSNVPRDSIIQLTTDILLSYNSVYLDLSIHMLECVRKSVIFILLASEVEDFVPKSWKAGSFELA